MRDQIDTQQPDYKLTTDFVIQYRIKVELRFHFPSFIYNEDEKRQHI